MILVRLPRDHEEVEWRSTYGLTGTNDPASERHTFADLDAAALTTVSNDASAYTYMLEPDGGDGDPRWNEFGDDDDDWSLYNECCERLGLTARADWATLGPTLRQIVAERPDAYNAAERARQLLNIIDLARLRS
jgi:hypothetical protein